MSDPVLDLLRACRPDDPDALTSERAAVRVLARVAVLEAGASRPATPRSLDAAPTAVVRTARALVACAACALICVAFALSGPAPRGAGSGGDTDAGGPAAEALDPMHVVALEALSGDAVARRRLRHAGPAGRAALIELAEAGRSEGVRALEALRSFGAPRGRDEIRRVAQLARDPTLSEPATAFLARDLGPNGARELGRLLVAEPSAANVAVAALESVARRGRREDALLALLEGTEAGCGAAAAAALRIGGAQGVERVLRVLSPQLASSSDVTAAVIAGTRTLRARIVRLAERGDRLALVLASGARLPETVAPLERIAVGGAKAEARYAVSLLAAYRTVEGALALGRARDGAASGAAGLALEHLGADVLNAVSRRASGSARDASAALTTLASAGPGGLERLERLADLPSLRGLAISALTSSPDGHASDVLVRLADQSSTRHAIVAALEHRVVAGDGGAVDALLALARPPLEQAVLRALARCGPLGFEGLARAAENPRLRRLANDLLERERRRTERPPDRGAPAAGVMARATVRSRSL